MKNEATDPQTPEEWQDAVDVAEVLAGVYALKQYGLVAGGPDINPERCEEILAAGLAQGCRPRPDAIQRLLPMFVRQP